MKKLRISGSAAGAGLGAGSAGTSPSVGLLLFFVVLILAIMAALIYIRTRGTVGIAPASYYSSAYDALTPHPLNITNVIRGSSGDGRYSIAPEASRTWGAPPDLRGAFIPPGAMPINVATHGIPEAYQQMGIIEIGKDLLPLYGRRNGRGTDIYNYYTRTDTYNPVQVPVSFGRRDCTEDMGCKEVSDGDMVKVYGKGEGRVKLYAIDAPRYIPGLV
jgi:hypothetical protein